MSNLSEARTGARRNHDVGRQSRPGGCLSRPQLGIPAVIVMPETTPSTKIERTRAHGAQVILSGETLADSQVTAEAMVKEKGYVLIHPYDDDKIIAGQGTIGIEMLEDEPGLDCIVVPIGGGGVISGIAIAAKHLKPQIEMLGVEVKLYPSMYHALRGQPADAAAGRSPKASRSRMSPSERSPSANNMSTMCGWSASPTSSAR